MIFNCKPIVRQLRREARERVWRRVHSFASQESVRAYRIRLFRLTAKARVVFLLVVSLSCQLTAAGQAISDTNETSHANQKVSFIRDVAPILVQNCEACHGVKQAESSYRLDTFKRLMTAGEFGVDPISPGDPDDSELLNLITSDDEDERMPKEGDPLAAAEIAVIRRWIEQGARFDGSDANATLRSILPRRPYPIPPSSYPAAVPITALAFTPDGSHLIVGGYHELTVWQTDTGRLVRRIGDIPERTYGLDADEQHSRLAVAGGAPGRTGEILLLDLKSDQRIASLARTEDVVFDVAFDPTNTHLATAAADRSVRIFEVASGDEIRLIENHADWVSGVSWSDDGKKIATASRDKSAKLFLAESGELLATYSGHGQPVYGVVIAADGKSVMTSGSDKKVHIWNSEDGKKIAEIGGYQGDVLQLARYNGHLFSASADKTVRKHTLEDRQQVLSLSDHSDWVYALAIHGETRRLACGCYDGSVKIWNLDDGKPVTTFIAAPGLMQSGREPTEQ